MTGAKRTRRTPSKRGVREAPSYPFLYFGADPADWFERSDMYLFSLCFEGLLDAAARRLVGERIAEHAALHFYPSFNVRAWRWGDLDGNTWAYCYAVRHSLADGVDESVLREIHAAVPIREVIFCDLRDGGRDRWTAWSRKQKTASKRVPHLDVTIKLDLIYLYRDREVIEVEGVVDKAFEEARSHT